MHAKITIKMDNAAFSMDDGSGPAQGAELARMLRELADRIQDDPEPQGCNLFDVNGNRVGRFDVTD